eukprot:evm.model.scf_575EXC.2 EVM.evm.TU.scf_575EXC.2   scf_575EXC:9226-28928(-)
MVSASFKVQAKALIRKNLTYQSRRMGTNCCTLMVPVFVLLLVTLLNFAVDKLAASPEKQCGCMCVRCCNRSTGLCRPAGPTDQCTQLEVCDASDKNVCGAQYSDQIQATYCAVEQPQSWPPLLMVHRSSQSSLPPWSPGAAFLYTANEPNTARELSQEMWNASDGPTKEEFERDFNASSFKTLSPFEKLWSQFIIGTIAFPTYPNYRSVMSRNIKLTSTLSTSCPALSNWTVADGVPDCSPALNGVLDSPDDVNAALFCSFKEANCSRVGPQIPESVREYISAWDFKDTSKGGFNVDVWLKMSTSNAKKEETRPNKAINMAANAWMRWATGDTQVSGKLLSLGEMPKMETRDSKDATSGLGPLFLGWVLQLLLPIILAQLVYEKENGLKRMMEMHGLGPSTYWLVNYVYYLGMYIAYISIFMIGGIALDWTIFTLNSYGIQLIFYLLVGNIQVANAFLFSCFTSNQFTAVTFSYIWIIGTGLISIFLYSRLIENGNPFALVYEMIPAFSAFRGVYELMVYAQSESVGFGEGMTWARLRDEGNGMVHIWVIMILEWFVFMGAVWLLEQPNQIPTLIGWRKKATNLVMKGRIRRALRQRGKLGRYKKLDLEMQSNDKFLTTPEYSNATSEASYDAPLDDATVVDDAIDEDFEDYRVAVQNLRKVYKGEGGAPDKVAVDGLLLGVKPGEVFGMLGPNGAGKTTTINMMVGITKPTSGDAIIGGFDIRLEMADVYSIMGVCPQYDRLWDSLTGREHLAFYGRLKGIPEAMLDAKVEMALQSVGLLQGGVGRKRVRTYSGGMKRRLSVAIAFMGHPTVIFLDEPSTGMDLYSRRNMWRAVGSAKRDKGIILTTHSMEEAEALCDRIGIFVAGRMVAVGSPKELKSKHGGFMVLSLTTAPEDTTAARMGVLGAWSDARETYCKNGLMKFELPSKGAAISSVFTVMNRGFENVQILDWSVASASLEDAFTKIVNAAGAAAQWNE